MRQCESSEMVCGGGARAGEGSLSGRLEVVIRGRFGAILFVVRLLDGTQSGKCM